MGRDDSGHAAEAAGADARAKSALRGPPHCLAADSADRAAGAVVPHAASDACYVAVGVSERGRAGAASPLAAVSFGPAPDEPADLKVEHNESQMIVSWTTTVQGARW